MPNLRTLHPEKYARVSNGAVDNTPSVLAIGYLTILMRHEDGWVPSLEKLVQKYLEGETSLGKARKTLRDEGYYVRVKFQHDGGKHHTDIWRASEPHTDVELDQIASYYVPGSIWQIPQVDKRGRHVRDARGQTVMRPVTVRSAQMESWRATNERITGKPVDNSPDSDVSAGRTDPPDSGGRDTDVKSPGHSFGGDLFPARPDPAHTGGRMAEGSDDRGVGNRGVPEKTSEETRENTTEETTEPFGNPQKVPILQKGFRGNAGHSDYAAPKQGDQIGDPLIARVRDAIGQSVCQAFDENPSMSEDELTRRIAEANTDLTHDQSCLYAATLLTVTGPSRESALP
ncbi:hypothetical protein FHX42_005240 [Saccharopolyspora lacisalsi]|uniref:Uncharacterized protein n=1 Tax=Halosaccharopolyspora lacisalsi TaxID=1000566 RepID=A0A839E3G9_9PSEU|nr:hypothetical protein [Halosaccharopolyspora lacisalsi]MBA8827833.1 hypothetical protein [Halosaccharopolyspora lacisalsi]